MSVEENLKALILSKYKSLREFCGAIGLPYSTVDSILRRGVENAGVGKIIKICRHFDISADELARGNITPAGRPSAKHFHLSTDEVEHIKKYRSLDERGKEVVDTILNSQYDAVKPKSDVEKEIS